MPPSPPAVAFPSDAPHTTPVPPLSRIAADAGLALAGAAVAGFVLALPEGPIAMLERAAMLPAIVIAVTVVMVPPLYIAATTFGVAPPAAAFLACASDALRSTGIVLLGLAPPLAFLSATSDVYDTIWLLGNAVFGLAALLGVRTLWYALFLGDPSPASGEALGGSSRVAGARLQRGTVARRPMLLYLLWLGVAASIASSLFQKTFE